MAQSYSSIKEKWHQLHNFKRGYYSALILIVLIALSLILELLINNKALVVSYQGHLYFPTYTRAYSGKVFDLDYEYETNYKELQAKWKKESSSNWLILPPIPFDPYEHDLSNIEEPPPNPPSWHSKHILGTDTNGKDILAQLAYGFRIAFFFALALYLISTFIGIIIGASMGYFTGIVDLITQRIAEIWVSLPSLYLIIIIASLITPTPIILLFILVLSSWTDMTWLMRAEIYREKSRQYCEVAKSIGAGHFYIIIRHLLPNCLTPLIARFPFQMAAGITALTSLDYLGYGLPIPTPSWGNLLKQGQEAFDYAPWILITPTLATVFVLLLFTFLGEALREIYNPKQAMTYS